MAKTLVNVQLQRLHLQLSDLGFSAENKSEFMDLFSYGVLQVIINEVVDTISPEEVDAIIQEVDVAIHKVNPETGVALVDKEDFDHLEFLLECLENRYEEFSTPETPKTFELIVENSLNAVYEIVKETKKTKNATEDQVLEEIQEEIETYLLKNKP